MITGFNTDVPYEGVTYHVQTEDKGLDSPLILSLVYVGGAIIASKRTPYEDLLGQGFDEQALTERLQRQHKLICAAIKSGRVEDLKRMGGANGGAAGPELETEAAGVTRAAKEPGRQRKKKAEPPPIAAEASTPAPTEEVTTPPAEAAESRQAKQEAPQETAEPQETTEPQAAEPQSAEPAAPTGAKKAEPEIVILATLADEISALGDFTPSAPPKPPAPPAPPVEAPPAQASATKTAEPVGVYPVVSAEVLGAQQDLSDELYLTLLDDEGEFRAGQLATVKVYVGRGTYGQRPEAEATVTVKVLGTSFRPLILTAATDPLGVAVLRALLPRFTSGRAAIIIRAVAGDDAAEMRRIIHQ